MSHEGMPSQEPPVPPAQEQALDSNNSEDTEKVIAFLLGEGPEETRNIQRRLAASLEQGEDSEEVHNLCLDYGICDDAAKRELLAHITKLLEAKDGQGTADREAAVEAVLDDVHERNKNDFLSWLGHPQGLRQTDPDLFKIMEDTYGRRLDQQAKALLLERLKK